MKTKTEILPLEGMEWPAIRRKNGLSASSKA